MVTLLKGIGVLSLFLLATADFSPLIERLLGI